MNIKKLGVAKTIIIISILIYIVYLTLLLAIMATGTTVFMVMLPHLFTVKGETLAYKEGKLFLAISEPVGLNNTTLSRFIN